MIEYNSLEKGKGKDEELDVSMNDKGYLKNKESGCLSTGMDQGFHNHLVYSGMLVFA